MTGVNPSLGAMTHPSRNNQSLGYPQRSPEGHGWPPSFPAPSPLQKPAGLECTAVLIPCFLLDEAGSCHSCGALGSSLGARVSMLHSCL